VRDSVSASPGKPRLPTGVEQKGILVPILFGGYLREEDTGGVPPLEEDPRG
jgi:hypothetical protein